MGELAYGPGGQLFDVSNVAYFAGRHRVVFAVRYRNVDEFGSEYLHDLKHASLRGGPQDNISFQTIANYTPTASGHPQGQLLVYRNKLVLAFRDADGWIRYAYWDNANSSTPWSGARSSPAAARHSAQRLLSSHSAGT